MTKSEWLESLIKDSKLEARLYGGWSVCTSLGVFKHGCISIRVDATGTTYTVSNMDDLRPITDMSAKVKELLEARTEGGHILDRSPEELQGIVEAATEAGMGVKDDKDKARWDLLPLKAVSSVVDVLTYGAHRKYSAWNWLRVDDADNRYFAAAMRHMVARRNGEILDPETGLPHLAHAVCCLLFSLHFDVNPDDRP